MVGMMEGGRMEQLMKRIPKVEKLPTKQKQKINKHRNKSS